jgi:excisionase family DNA binding protein
MSDYPPSPSLDDLLTVKQITTLLGISRELLLDARFGDPALPFFRIGRHYLFSKAQVTWWLNQKQPEFIQKANAARDARIASMAARGERAAALAKARKGR